MFVCGLIHRHTLSCAHQLSLSLSPSLSLPPSLALSRSLSLTLSLPLSLSLSHSLSLSLSPPMHRESREEGELPQFQCRVDLPLPEDLVVFARGPWDDFSADTRASVTLALTPSHPVKEVGAFGRDSRAAYICLAWTPAEKEEMSAIESQGRLAKLIVSFEGTDGAPATARLSPPQTHPHAHPRLPQVTSTPSSQR
jgi:hypothetical protein